LTGCQGKKFRQQREYEPGHLAKQALIGFEVWAEYLGKKEPKSFLGLFGKKLSRNLGRDNPSSSLPLS